MMIPNIWLSEKQTSVSAMQNKAVYSTTAGMQMSAKTTERLVSRYSFFFQTGAYPNVHLPTFKLCLITVASALYKKLHC